MNFKLLRFLTFFVILIYFNIGVSSASIFSKATIASNGRFQLDGIIWSDTSGDSFVSGGHLKSTDLFVKGQLDTEIKYFLHLNFANILRNSSFYQGYFRFGDESSYTKVGQMIIPIGLEQSIDSGNRIFMEQPYVRGLEFNRYFGMNFKFSDNHYTFSLFLMGPDEGKSFESNYQARYNASFRFTLCPSTFNNFLHFGINFKASKSNLYTARAEKAFKYSDIPSLYNSKALLKTTASPLPRRYVLGFEHAIIANSLSFQSEFICIDARWKDYTKESYYIFYAQVAYILTGESRRYDRALGTIFDPKPISQNGLLEIAFRYTFTNLKSKGPLLRGCSLNDGRKESIVLATNWILNQSFKIQFNAVSEKYYFRDEDKYNHNVSGLGLRFQLLF